MFSGDEMPIVAFLAALVVFIVKPNSHTGLCVLVTFVLACILAP